MVAISGDGRLRDGTVCESELRAYLREVPSRNLAGYAAECLHNAFEDSGLVLQDVVNEVGRRLEFDVENGRYRGVQGAVGFDGIWRAPGDVDLIVEVKTTDTYNVNLDNIARFKASLVAMNKVSKDASTLFVVGKKDSGALEAQIRGSRYAWEMRVVGVDSLIKLMTIKEKSTEEATVRQIRELLQPFEYTRIDKIVDVVFDTAVDVEQAADEPIIEVTDSDSEASGISSGQQRTQPQVIDALRERIVGGLQKKLHCQFVKRRRALFETSDQTVRVSISLSKRYDREYQPYWYAYHPSWDEFLSGARTAYVVLGCVDRQDAFAVPHDQFASFLPKLSRTVREDGKSYWHIVLVASEAGSLCLYSSRTGDLVDLEQFSFELA